MMTCNEIVEKNRKDWNSYSEKWSAFNHSEKILRPVLDDPAKAFHKKTWELIQSYLPDLRGKRVCVPSSGDNLAVFAFALSGAAVTSCDISENQLAHARQVAVREGLGDAIEFVCADTMKLEGIPDGGYDLVYTSNGVHVWLNDLPSMYANVNRILKKGGLNIVYEIHPHLRPFDEELKIIKPYDATGPFEDETTVNFHWRLQDIMNAMMHSGMRLEHFEEMFDEKDYERPFWLKTEDIINGLRASREEVDRMYDWRENPSMALPHWICLVGRKV